MNSIIYYNYILYIIIINYTIMSCHSKKCCQNILVILVDIHDGLIKDQILVIHRAAIFK